jgi:hypothetical protein
MRIARWINVADVRVGGGYMRVKCVDGFQGERELDEKINGEFLEFETFTHRPARKKWIYAHRLRSSWRSEMRVNDHLPPKEIETKVNYMCAARRLMDIFEADRSKPLEKNLDFIRRARDGGRIRPICWRTV